MKCRNSLFVFGWLLVVGVICGCKPKKDSPKDAKLQGNTYTNSFFGFQIRVPETWTILDSPSKRELQRGTELILGGDKEMAAAAAASAEEGHYLLTARNLANGMSLGVAAEDVMRTPEIRTGEEYLNMILEVITGADKPLQQVGKVVPVKLGSKEFYRADLAGELMGRTIHQAMFVSIEKGYALVVAIGARSESAVDRLLAEFGLSVPPNQNVGRAKEDPAAKPQQPSVPSRHQVTATQQGSAEPSWVSEIKLQGVGGSEARRFAIINGKTFAQGDAIKVKTAEKLVLVRCVAVGKTSASVAIEGVAGERELKLVRN